MRLVPMMAPIMSVWASGRYFIFWMLLPGPRPKTPPEPMAICACTFWYASPVGSAQGFRKDCTRLRW